MGPRSFSQLKVGGGKPVASQERDTKLFTTAVTVSGLRPIMVGGTERKKKTFSIANMLLMLHNVFQFFPNS